MPTISQVNTRRTGGKGMVFGPVTTWNERCKVLKFKDGGQYTLESVQRFWKRLFQPCAMQRYYYDVGIVWLLQSCAMQPRSLYGNRFVFMMVAWSLRCDRMGRIEQRTLLDITLSFTLRILIDSPLPCEPLRLLISPWSSIWPASL